MEDMRGICPPLRISWGNTWGHSLEKISQSLQQSWLISYCPIISPIKEEAGKITTALMLWWVVCPLSFPSNGSPHVSKVSLMTFCYNIDFILLSTGTTHTSWKTFHKPLNNIRMLVLTGSLHACGLTWGRPTASDIIISRSTASRSDHLCCTRIKGYFLFGQLQNNRTWLETAVVRTAASEPQFWSSLRLAID